MAQRVSKNGRRLGHTVGSVYLVHLSRALNGARHYLGFSTNVAERMRRHKAGRGAPLLAEAAKRGIGFKVVRRWLKRDGYFEQELKRGGIGQHCPMCRKRGGR